jgi:hypothetical protein
MQLAQPSQQMETSGGSAFTSLLSIVHYWNLAPTTSKCIAELTIDEVIRRSSMEQPWYDKYTGNSLSVLRYDYA